MLRSMHSGYSVKENYTAMERMTKRGINVTGSLILGAAGESEETISNTERFARKMVTYPNLTQLYCAILTPFPGANLSKAFLEKNKHFFTDVWDTEESKRAWVECFCNVSYDLLEEKAREINNLNPSSRKRYFGLKKLNN